jgi:hypothetical protein
MRSSIIQPFFEKAIKDFKSGGINATAANRHPTVLKASEQYYVSINIGKTPRERPF